MRDQVSVNIAALVAANTSPTRSIDPAKIKARFLESESWPRRPGLCQLGQFAGAYFGEAGSCAGEEGEEKGALPLLSCTLCKYFTGSTVVVQARISEIQEALQETKAVQEMKEQVHPSFISCKQIHSGKT